MTTEDEQSPEVEVEADEDVGHFHFTATKTQTQRIDQFLTSRVSYLSRSAVQRLIDDGLVKVREGLTSIAEVERMTSSLL